MTTWERLASASLSGVGNTGTFTPKKHLRVEMFIVHSGSIQPELTCGYNTIDGDNNYTTRGFSAAVDSEDFTRTTQDSIELERATSGNMYLTFDIINIADEEKLINGNVVSAESTGAGNAPVRWEIVGKWTNVSNQINIIGVKNTQGGSFSSGTTITVWGADDQGSTAKDKSTITNVEAGTRYEETDTRKIFRKGELTTANNETGGTNTGTHAFVMVGKITGLPVGETIKSVQVNCGTTDSANWRCGYYSDTSGVPNALMEDIGVVGALSTGFNTGTANGTQVVPSDGIVWVAIQFSTASATYVGRTGSTGGYSDANAYASGLPDPYSSGGADRAVDVKITTTGWVEKGTA